MHLSLIVSSFSFFRVSMLPIMCDSRHSRSILMIQKCDFFNRWQIDSVLHRFLALFHATCQTRRDSAQRALLSHCQVQVHELAKTHTHTCTMTSMDCDATWKISLYNVHNVNHNLKHHFVQWKLWIEFLAPWKISVHKSSWTAGQCFGEVTSTWIRSWVGFPQKSNTKQI